jgi:hypothetical protein
MLVYHPKSQSADASKSVDAYFLCHLLLLYSAGTREG